jgi:multiple antibiotic resistance protein
VALSTADIYLQAIIAVAIIVNPIDPVKILIFNSVIERQQLARRRAATRVALAVLLILEVAALAGRELLELLGIKLGAFGVVGGLLVAAMGFEMLFGGQSSRAQGSHEVSEEQPEQEGLIMPLAMPLMAGPCAITTVITVSSFRSDGSTIVAAAVAVAIVAVAVFIGFAYLGSAFARLKPATAAMAARIGGLLLATIGAQLILGGIRSFYGF